MRRKIAVFAVIGLVAGPSAAAAGSVSDDGEPMAGESAVSRAYLERVRGLGNEKDPRVAPINARATGVAGTNRIGDAFADFGGVGHVIQNNGSGAAIGITTEINVGPQVTVGPQG